MGRHPGIKHYDGVQVICHKCGTLAYLKRQKIMIESSLVYGLREPYVEELDCERMLLSNIIEQ